MDIDLIRLACIFCTFLCKTQYKLSFVTLIKQLTRSKRIYFVTTRSEIWNEQEYHTIKMLVSIVMAHNIIIRQNIGKLSVLKSQYTPRIAIFEYQNAFINQKKFTRHTSYHLHDF